MNSAENNGHKPSAKCSGGGDLVRAFDKLNVTKTRLWTTIRIRTPSNAVVLHRNDRLSAKALIRPAIMMPVTARVLGIEGPMSTVVRRTKKPGIR
jgi:hypothetical protein